MTNINKNKLIIASIVFIIIAGAIFFLQSESRVQLFQKEQLVIEQDLTPIELTLEEQQALKDAGLEIPSGEDALAKDLQSVRTSDELDAIEADINETNLSGLDAELDAITADLFEL